MNTGCVPNIFSNEEKQTICDRMLVLDRRRDKSKRTDGSPHALFNYFMEYCREMLHIILVMSPFGTSFRNRLRKFPSLINFCTIDWFHVILFLVCFFFIVYKFMFKGMA
jgi:dynein heavy chain, axonemal